MFSFLRFAPLQIQETGVAILTLLASLIRGTDGRRRRLDATLMRDRRDWSSPQALNGRLQIHFSELRHGGKLVLH